MLVNWFKRERVSYVEIALHILRGMRAKMRLRHQNNRQSFNLLL